jgi:hypothetical protein
MDQPTANLTKSGGFCLPSSDEKNTILKNSPRGKLYISLSGPNLRYPEENKRKLTK